MERLHFVNVTVEGIWIYTFHRDEMEYTVFAYNDNVLVTSSPLLTEEEDREFREFHRDLTSRYICVHQNCKFWDNRE